MFLTFQNKSHF